MSKRGSWKIPAYCLFAEFLCYQLLIRAGLGRFATVALLRGDRRPWMRLSGISFLIILAVGWALFRKLPRRELSASASILAMLSILFGMLPYVTDGELGYSWRDFCQWDSIVFQLLKAAGVEKWISKPVTWALPPYIFVLFGKKEESE